MTDLPFEVQRARELLRDVEALPGAEVRIYRRIMATPAHHGIAGLRFSVVGLGLLLSASAALGFGLAPRLLPPSRIVATTAAPKPSPPRLLPRGAAPRTAKPSPVEQTTSEGEPVAPNLDGQPAAARGVSALPIDPTATERVGATKRHEASAVSREPAAASPSGKARSLPGASSVGSSHLGQSISAASSSASPPASALSLQVAEYMAAVENLDAQPTEALARLRAYRQRWPSSAILHEVDLRIVQVLVRLGRDVEAKAAAQSFLIQYPGSARAAEVRRIAESE